MKPVSSDFADLNIVEALPHSRYAPEGAEDLFRRLRGATIERIGGTDDDASIEGGGLVIDYVTAGGLGGRVVFGFNENGMWVEYDDGAASDTHYEDQP
jgi:hypothetical protein